MASADEGRKAPVRMIGLPGPGGRGHGHGGVERANDPRGALRRLMDYLGPYKRGLVLVLVVAALSTALALAGPWLMGRAIDHLVDRNLELLLHFTLLMLGAYVLSSVAQGIQGVLLARLSQRAMLTLRGDLFGHMQTLSLRFFDSRAQGDLMSRLTNDMDTISRVLTNNVAQLFTGLLTLVGIMAVMFAMNAWLALGSMIVFPLMIGLVAAVGKRTRGAFRGYQTNLGNLNAVLEETYSGQRVVLAYGQEESALTKFDEANEAVRSTGTQAMTLAFLVMPMMGILANANVAILGGLGGWMAINGMVTIGTIAAFITYSRRFAEPLRQLGDLYNQIQGALAGGERIFEILDTSPDQSDAPDALELTGVRGEVTFEKVTFSYVPGVPVLKGVDLHARPGQRIALVGPTGAGKTTLVNLLSRFYDLDEGTIRIDGVDIRGMTRDSLRRELGVVLQQSFLFVESVKENIRYGRLDATDEEVYEAARLAQADGFIRRLPQGYDTVLSERGASLSEGQRQLVTIARAILADPAILVLDEATSSVDTRTEVHIQKALRELMKGRTSFVIAHRLSTISNADQVLVIDEGRIVERGTHVELLARKGFYYRLYMSQFRGEGGGSGSG
ncbi:MAG: ABC transporter ATP-binding protein [Gemmatimonadota bacterium]